MRILLALLSLTLIASCTLPGRNTTPTGTGTTPTPTTAKYDVALQKSIPSPTYGTGKHMITIYADFQCPACIAFSHSVGGLLESYAASGKAMITYWHEGGPNIGLAPNEDVKDAAEANAASD